MFEFTGVQVAFFLFFILMPIALYKFFKLGFVTGAECMAKQLHESAYITPAGIKDLGLDLLQDAEEE